MNFPEITENSIDVACRTLKSDAEKNGYRLNPDDEFVKNLVRGLIKNEQRYGYRACPCRLASGKKDEDLDIICPCDYRDADIEEHGACYCALYVNEAIASGKQKAAPVPDAARPGPRGVNSLLSGLLRQQRNRSFPYRSGVVKSAVLCAREQPPEVARSARRQRKGLRGSSKVFLMRSIQKQGIYFS